MWDIVEAEFARVFSYKGYRNDHPPGSPAHELSSWEASRRIAAHLDPQTAEQQHSSTSSTSQSAMDISPAVRAVCEQHDMGIDPLQHLIYSFLDCSTLWPLNLAALDGHLRLVQKLSKRQPRAFERCCEEAMDSAAEFGHLDVVKWLHENRKEGCTTDAMDLAASNGHLHVIQWLHEHREEGCTTSAMDFAAGNGHLHVVRWLHSHRSEGCTVSAMDNAATGGHLDVMRWLHANRKEGCSKSALLNASYSGHPNIVQWLMSIGSPRCIRSAAKYAIARGHVDLAQWLVKQKKHQILMTDFSESDDESDSADEALDGDFFV